VNGTICDKTSTQRSFFKKSASKRYLERKLDDNKGNLNGTTNT
jgi:hypothetical protein